MQILGSSYLKYERHTRVLNYVLNYKPISSTESTDESQKVEEARQEQEISSAQQDQSKTPPVIVSFMKRIGLNPTNLRDVDIDMTTEKLEYLEILAKTDEEKRHVSELQYEFTLLTLMAALEAKSTKQSENKKVPPNSTVGMEQLGNINKFFINHKNPTVISASAV